MISVNVTELRTHLKDYLERVENGEKITIIRNSMIIGHLTPSEDAKKNIKDKRSRAPSSPLKLSNEKTVKFRRFGAHEDPAPVQQLHKVALEAAGALVGNRAELDMDLSGPANYYDKLNGEFWVGEIDDEIVAIGAFRLALDSPPDTAELKRMRVKPELQGRGIGGTILKLLEKRAKHTGYTSMVLNVTTAEGQAPARHLYETHGYVEFKRQKFEDYVSIYYRKEL